jgi:predicted nucleotidyltransferase
MEDIKERLTEQNYYFLKKFQEYIGNELILFGSIKRFDFLQKYSDIDIAIISDNIENTLVRLKHFLNIDKTKIRKLFQKLPNTNNIVHGYKINYDNIDIDNNLSLEIMLYDEKYRKQIINSVNDSNNIPFFITYILFIIKLLHYELNIISNETLKYIKRSIMEPYFNQKLHDNLIAIKI